MRGPLGVGDLTNINEVANKWREAEHKKWKLVSFDEHDARFGWLVGDMYTKYVNISKSQIEFVRGIECDACD
jgi:hypothetical protein